MKLTTIALALTLPVLVVLGALGGCGGGSGPGGGATGNAQVYVTNDSLITTRAAVTEFYLKPTGTSDWGPNLISDPEGVPLNETRHVTDVPEGTYDARAGAGDYRCVWWGAFLGRESMKVYVVEVPLRPFPLPTPQFPLKGESGPHRVHGGHSWWMTTSFELGNTGLITLKTTLESKDAFGFHGTVLVIFYDENDNPVAATTPAPRYWVNLYDKNEFNWTHQIPAGVAQTVHGYQILQVWDPEIAWPSAELLDWLQFFGQFVVFFV